MAKASAALLKQLENNLKGDAGKELVGQVKVNGSPSMHQRRSKEIAGNPGKGNF
jgi:hypothetical protein